MIDGNSALHGGHQEISNLFKSLLRAFVVNVGVKNSGNY